uniref:Fluoride ion transporter CrcB n=1 Tax=Spongospora subterranea TaxID=70186 RepID=A0A0H5RA43_9EUKA|eukprot:CRZ10671.1 hypothetical protein [Spongospora subterranea]
MKNYWVMFLAMALAACIGTFVRCALFVFTDANNIAGTTTLANAIGCFIVGLLKQQRSLHSDFVYHIIASGFCGSLTSFSSWQQSSSVLFVTNKYPYGGLLVLGVGMCLWFGSLYVGMHSSCCGRHFLPISIAIAVLAAVILAIFYPLTTKFYIAILLAPIGSLSRYFLSVYLNHGANGRLGNWYPFGTFAANCIACIILGTTLLITKNPTHSVIIGISGTLSTVSTFVSEVDTIKDTTSRQYIFAISSIVAAQILLLCFNVAVY